MIDNMPVMKAGMSIDMKLTQFKFSFVCIPWVYRPWVYRPWVYRSHHFIVPGCFVRSVILNLTA
jgi:hypothetical protein